MYHAVEPIQRACPLSKALPLYKLVHQKSGSVLYTEVSVSLTGVSTVHVKPSGCRTDHVHSLLITANMLETATVQGPLGLSGSVHHDTHVRMPTQTFSISGSADLNVTLVYSLRLSVWRRGSICSTHTHMVYDPVCLQATSFCMINRNLYKHASQCNSSEKFLAEKNGLPQVEP